MMILKLSWRNLWRNRRRTMITCASIFFAIFLALVVNSMEQGSWDRMIYNVIGNHTGYGQIQTKEYFEDGLLDDAFEYENWQHIVGQSRHTNHLVPRLEGFALGASGNRTRGVMVVGIDPALENNVTSLEGRITEGQYLADKDDGILIGQGVARLLEISIDDTLVLLGQGYQGNSAVGQYPVRGIVRFPIPEQNNSYVYLALPEAQWFFAAPGMITSLIIDPADGRLNRAIQELEEHLPEGFYVLSWKELMPELLEAMQADVAGTYLALGIIYMIIAFGIFSTILMMTAERKHEFGVLLAIGMKRGLMGRMMAVESFFMATIGILAGVLFSLPIIAYLNRNPIPLGEGMAGIFDEYGFEPMFYFHFSFELFFIQSVIIWILALLVSIYPLVVLGKLNAVKAMRGA